MDSIKVCPDKMGTTYSDDELTDWQFSTSSTGSNDISRYTIVAVTAVLGETISSIGAGAAGVSVALAAVAGMIVSDEMPRVYYYQEVYYKFLIGTDPPLPRAEETVTNFYLDSNRTNQIGDTVYYEYYL